VPEDGDKDVSAIGAWKPPGVIAAKARAAAKVVLLKAKAVWEKAALRAESRLQLQNSLKEKMTAAKQAKEEVDEVLAGLGGGRLKKRLGGG